MKYLCFQRCTFERRERFKTFRMLREPVTHFVKAYRKMLEELDELAWDSFQQLEAFRRKKSRGQKFRCRSEAVVL